MPRSLLLKALSFSCLKHERLVRDGCGDTAMAHQDDGPALCRRPQGRENCSLVQAIESARRLVEQHEGGTRDERATEPHALPLPIGKRRPVHADGCVESLRQTIDNLSKRGGIDGALKLLVARPKTSDEEVDVYIPR